MTLVNVNAWLNNQTVSQRCKIRIFTKCANKMVKNLKFSKKQETFYSAIHDHETIFVYASASFECQVVGLSAYLSQLCKWFVEIKFPDSFKARFATTQTFYSSIVKNNLQVIWSHQKIHPWAAFTLAPPLTPISRFISSLRLTKWKHSMITAREEKKLPTMCVYVATGPSLINFCYPSSFRTSFELLIVLLKWSQIHGAILCFISPPFLCEHWKSFSRVVESSLSVSFSPAQLKICI